MVTDTQVTQHIGNKLSFIFAPLGFSDWRLSTSDYWNNSKESVVSTLSVIFAARRFYIMLRMFVSPVVKAHLFLTLQCYAVLRCGCFRGSGYRLSCASRLSNRNCLRSCFYCLSFSFIDFLIDK